MSKIVGYRFVVMGHGRFPFDMLRYDEAHPRDTFSAEQLSSVDVTGQPIRGIREVSLFSPRHLAPTVDRWASFGWAVKADSIEVVWA